MMNENKIIGFSITTDLIFNNKKEDDFSKLLIDMEQEISNLLETKYDIEILRGKGRFIRDVDGCGFIDREKEICYNNKKTEN